MRVLLDESVPRRLAAAFPESFGTRTVQQMGWAQLPTTQQCVNITHLTGTRRDATARMDALRARLPTVRTDRIARGGCRGLGSPEVWRRIGTVHHITEVTRSLTSLPGS